MTSDRSNDSLNGKPMEVNVRVKEFSHPGEREEFIEMVKISSQFDMRYRGLLEFYGSDLVAYKRQNKKSERVNTFLRVLSTYLTDHMEDQPPSSWQDCHPPFWEELIYLLCPHYLKISPKQNESIIFLSQLNKFVQWLDRRSGLSWSSVAAKYVDDARFELKLCEQILNDLHFYSFPRFNHNDWDPFEDLSKINKNLELCAATVDSVFEVMTTDRNITKLRDIDSSRTYSIVNFPSDNLIPGILLNGMIGRMRDDYFWNWHITGGVYPQKAKKYIRIAR